MPPIYVINRANDTARMSAISASAEAAGLSITRIEAVDGHDPDTPLFLYRNLIGERFWGAEEIKPGALGCYLSHLACWRRLLADGHETALIVEDDLIFAPEAAARVETATKGADITFLNARMAAWRGDAEGPLPLADALTAMKAAGQAPGAGDLAAAPGADAYLLTAEGARRLIEDVTARRITCGVDWAMLAAATPAETRPDWAEFAALADRPALDPPLRAVIGDPVGDQSNAESTIGHTETRPIATLLTGPEIGVEGLEIPAGDPRDPVMQAFAGGRFYEAPALEMLRRWMPKGGVFVDIGAHIGGHTVFMLRHGGAGRAIPVEFDPRAVETLREVATAYGLTDRIDEAGLGVAVGEERRKLERTGPTKLFFPTRLRPGFVENVPVRPGDSLLRETQVDLIKIDVNGEEKMVLQGLKKTLKRKRPIVAMDLTRPKSPRAIPFLLRQHYREAERAVWQDETGERAFAIFTPTPIPGRE